VQARAGAFLSFVQKLGRPMALFQEDPAQFLITLDNMLLSKMNLKRPEVDSIVGERSRARLAKDFKKSDELRDKLSAMGISVMDYPGGSFWEVTK
jgi:cysteinyl-tRNA synthetase